MGIRKTNKNGKINLLVRSDNRDVQLDVGITPIYCVICQKQLPDLYEHLGSRCFLNP